MSFIYSMTDTWTDGGVTYTAVKMNVTDTASAAGALLMDLQIGGSSLFRADKNGSVVAQGSLSTGSNANIGWGSRTQLQSPSNGVMTMFNVSGTDFARLQFGGTTSSFPALKRSSTAIAVRLADDSADAPLTASYLKTATTTVASLPAAGTAGAGARHFVTDATATTFMSTVSGGGANSVPVVSDGTNWLIG